MKADQAREAWKKFYKKNRRYLIDENSWYSGWNAALDAAAEVAPKRSYFSPRKALSDFQPSQRIRPKGSVTEPRRQVTLPSSDQEYLDGLALPWETIKQDNQQWLLLHDWQILVGYNCETATIALLIDTNYTDTQIDSFYVFPVLKRNDGGNIKQSAHLQAIDGKQFQFWSRHRTQTNPWRSGTDDIASHLALVSEWLKRSLSD